MIKRSRVRQEAQTKSELQAPETKEIAGRHRFRCSKCKASYRARGFLSRHMQLHSEEAQPREGARGRADRRRDRLESANIAGNEDNFSCEECGRCFTQKINLAYHMRIHAGQRPYVCAECDAAFSQEINLKSHMRVHTGERPFSCKVCKATFKQKSALDNHVRVHTGERPYLCDHCGAVFAQKSNLDSHMLKHGVINPPSSKLCRANQTEKTHRFVCDDCARRFRRKAALLKHMRTHNL